MIKKYSVFDPVTSMLSKFAWAMWAIIWISLSFGVGQADFFPESVPEVPVVYKHNSSILIISTIAAILLWSSVILQTVRQVYYSDIGHPLVKIGRWMILIAVTIFAYRMTYTLAMYGGPPSSVASLIGVCILALGLNLNTIGMMQQHYFDTKYNVSEDIKWNPSWKIEQ